MSEVNYKEGTNAMNKKENILMDLFQKMGPNEIKFTIRFLLKNYKIGAAEAIIEYSLARAMCSNYFDNQDWYDNHALNACADILEIPKCENKDQFCVQIVEEFQELTPHEQIKFSMKFFQLMQRSSPDKSQKEISNEVFMKWEENLKSIISQYPYHKHVIEGLLMFGHYKMIKNFCKLTPGVPCKPMLAKPTKSINEIFTRFEGKKFTCEYKYDGLRGQFHYYRNKKTKEHTIQLFSRNLEDMTDIYLDLVEPLEKWAQASNLDSFIIDAEIMAFNSLLNRILSFQVLSTRARKAGTAKADKKNVEVCLFIFDVLYVNSETLLESTFSERRSKLDSMDWNVCKNSIRRAHYKNLDNLEDIQDYLEESIKEGCEGLMVKTLEKNATYHPSKRTFKWLKLKKDYISNNGLGDSFDLVIVGACWGEGKRTGKFGTFLVASYNDAMDTYESCCKVGTGFSDKMLDHLYEHFKTKVDIKMGYTRMLIL